ncbi:MAG: asparagine synthase (glutamine-hydrolyzing) [Acidobacteria bacterium]|nr:asparagine synthase (glutamine-hydrolyzing) [Acidobacteriota bacterium]
MVGPEWLMPKRQRQDVINEMCQIHDPRHEANSATYVQRGVALGMRQAARTPIGNEDSSVWIVFDGEIYNHRELRRFLQFCGHRFRTESTTESGAEVVLHLYEELGDKCVEKLRGCFGFAVWDGRNEKLLLARDRVGHKPMHFLHAGDTIIFGTEIKSILPHPLVRREINYEAISDYLSFGYVPDPKTAFRGIEKLPPGHTLTFQYGQVEKRRYWDFNFAPLEEPMRSEREYVAELRDRLKATIQLQTKGDDATGVLLSGGLDSSLIVGTLAQLKPEPVKTFAIGFSENGFDELEYARVAAQRFNTEHHEHTVTPDAVRLVEEIVWHHDEPFADVSSIPSWFAAQQARAHVSAVLTGDGGDELFAGYERYARHQARNRYERLPKAARQNFVLPLSAALPQVTPGKNFLRNIALDPAARYVDSLALFSRQQKRGLLGAHAALWLGNYVSDSAFINLFNAPDTTASIANNIERMLYLDSKTYLPGDLMAKVNRMSAAHSLETRAPFLDHELIEFAQRIPASLKLNGTSSKYILRQAAKGLVPEVIIQRPKKGFSVPLAAWFQGELKGLLYDTLTDQRTRDRSLLNQSSIRSLMNEHQIGRRDHSRQLWSLLTLELWLRAFIDQRPERTTIQFRAATDLVNIESADQRVRALAAAG